MDLNIIILAAAGLSLLLLVFLIIKLSGKKETDYSKIIKEEILSEIGKLSDSVKKEFSGNRDEYARNAKIQREEVANSFKTLAGQVRNSLADLGGAQKEQLEIFSKRLENLTAANESKFDSLQEKIRNELKEMRQNNEIKLEEMRRTVDEKLHETLEKRLNESFKLVSERLEQVYKGLGDMQELARGVGDLKNVLTNVKTRGTWGEVQLENLIEQILTREQYEKNVQTKKGSNDKVEIAIKLPGRENSPEDRVWLPIDAKFPIEDYQRMLEAQDSGNLEMMNESSKAIERRIKNEAKKISEKYIDPPNTTDFAIMFLPVEGLYAEVLRKPGLAEIVQRDFRVTLAGPTTIAALLNSLQMGFRTLAIEKRSSEVWQILSGVKTEFNKFGEALDKTKKKLQEATNSIETASVRTRAIERKLRNVEELPENGETKLLGEQLTD